MLRVDDRRAALVLALSLASAALAQAWVPTRRMADKRPPTRLADWVPTRFGNWSEDRSLLVLAPPPDVQANLDQVYDQMLGRTYINPMGSRIMLSLAYGGDQRGGLSVHLPEVCYPAQGFAVHKVWADNLVLPDRTLRVRRATTALGPRKEPLTYWLLTGDQVVAPGLENRRVQLAHTLRGEIADGMLVRLSSIDADPVRAFAAHNRFASELLLALPASECARLFGQAPDALR